MKRPDAMTRAELEEEVSRLREELGLAREEDVVGRFAAAWGLTPKPAALFAALYAAGGVVRSRRALLLDVYGWRPLESHVIDAMLVRLRRVLPPGAIVGRPGLGWALSSEQVQACAIVAGHRPPERRRGA